MSELFTKFKCPNCGSAELSDNKNQINCGSCGLSFPKTGQIPWLFPQPIKEIYDWQNRYHLFLENTRLDTTRLKHDASTEGLLASTKRRLSRLVQAKTEHAREVTRILKALDIKDENGPGFASLGAGTELPSTQSLMGYYANLCRDWSYGEEENTRCLAEILNVLGEDKELGSLGVIGSGACRLAYDIHRKCEVKETINTDINPYLLLVAQRLVSGKSLNLYEFPIAPRSLEDSAVKLKCKAPEPLTQDFYFALADGMNPVFAEKSLNTILTPWLIDIVHQDFKDQVLRFNHCLELGGRWLNFGSVVFYHDDQKICYSVDEVLEIVRSSGFDIERYRHEEIPYLHSPHSCQRRYERVLTFSARKTDHKELPKERFNYLPEWLRDITVRVPKTDKSIQQSMVHQSLGKIMSLIDGKRSIKDMAASADFLQLPVDNAEAVIRNVLTKFFNDNVKGQQF